MITEQEFRQLPKEEQNFRWALFLKSNGGVNALTPQQIKNLEIKFLIKKESLPKEYFEGR